MWEAVVASLIALAMIFWFFGWRWESSLRRPRMSSLNQPLVSIIIPAHNAEHTTEEAIISAKKSSYPKKEIIVVNDSKDRTIDICRKHKVKLIQNEKRLGKPRALNSAVKKAKGEILFFMDADTTMDAGCLSRIMPWFSSPDIAAVSPRYVAKNKKGIWSRLASLENSFNSALFKTHMYFGSMISFRGCGIAIRKNIFKELGGWSNTLIEDVDFAAKVLRAGYKIQYEPKARVKTREAETLSELKRQRIRWGKGTGYSFINHRGVYTKSPQFVLHFFPYIFLIFAVIGIFALQLYFLIPVISFYVLYTLSLTKFTAFFIAFILPLFYSFLTAVTTGSISHLAIVMYREKEKSNDMLYIIPYIFVYIPIVMFFYFKGIFLAAKNRRKSKNEFDLRDW